jgi:KUP system potassium uptake protein
LFHVGPLYWPTFVIAVVASIIASQAIVSGAFSIVSQALSMGCFPRVKVVHTSTTHEGQVYIPAINYMFLFACIAVTILFRTSQKLSNAYGNYASISSLTTRNMIFNSDFFR